MTTWVHDELASWNTPQSPRQGRGTLTAKLRNDWGCRPETRWFCQRPVLGSQHSQQDLLPGADCRQGCRLPAPSQRASLPSQPACAAGSLPWEHDQLHSPNPTLSLAITSNNYSNEELSKQYLKARKQTCSKRQTDNLRLDSRYQTTDRAVWVPGL